jgi:hypothetical protein
MKLLLTGGITGEYSRLAEYLGRERAIVMGCIDQLDESTGEITHLKRVTVPDEYRDTGFRKDFRLTAATIVGSRLYIGSATQVLIFSWPSLELVQEIDSPYFHDIHHVTVIGDLIYVMSTGLDAVLTFRLNGEFNSIKSVILADVWEKFNRDTDYRKIGTLKPHDAHPNFVFEMNGDVWCTRFKQRDVVKLSDLNSTIPVSDHAGIHDGFSFGDSIFFTSVNGHVIELSKSAGKIVEDLDLNKLDDRGVPLGWCRGLYVTKDYFFIGFSVLRTTKLEENLAWLNSEWKDRVARRLPSRVVVVDRRARKITREFNLAYPDVDMIFTILGI